MESMNFALQGDFAMRAVASLFLYNRCLPSSSLSRNNRTRRLSLSLSLSLPLSLSTIDTRLSAFPSCIAYESFEKIKHSI